MKEMKEEECKLDQYIYRKVNCCFYSHSYDGKLILTYILFN